MKPKIHKNRAKIMKKHLNFKAKIMKKHLKNQTKIMKKHAKNSKKRSFSAIKGEVGDIFTFFHFFNFHDFQQDSPTLTHPYGVGGIFYPQRDSLRLSRENTKITQITQNYGHFQEAIGRKMGCFTFLLVFIGLRDFASWFRWFSFCQTPLRGVWCYYPSPTFGGA